MKWIALALIIAGLALCKFAGGGLDKLPVKVFGALLVAVGAAVLVVAGFMAI